MLPVETPGTPVPTKTCPATGAAAIWRDRFGARRRPDARPRPAGDKGEGDEEGEGDDDVPDAARASPRTSGTTMVITNAASSPRTAVTRAIVRV
jgi:hypothetical protein